MTSKITDGLVEIMNIRIRNGWCEEKDSIR